MLILFLDPASNLWKGQPSRIPKYLELKTQSNQDIREVSAAASRAPSHQPSPAPKTSEKENNRPSEPTSFMGPRIEDIRFRQAASSPQTSNPIQFNNKPSQPSASSKTNNSSKPAFYNRGQPRTYLSDRHLRNVDVRELSSNRVSFGYQYPSPAGQSAGPTKKVPEGFSRPKPPSKPPTHSKY